jgi:hypothetical protein
LDLRVDELNDIVAALKSRKAAASWVATRKPINFEGAAAKRMRLQAVRET